MRTAADRRAEKIEAAIAVVRNMYPEKVLRDRERELQEKKRAALKDARWRRRESKRAKEERAAFVYFLRAGEFVKIGQSNDWKRRMATMQTGSPYTIVPLLILKSTIAHEKKLHTRFRADHYRGEWFHLGPAIQAFIKENRSNCVAKSGETKILPPPPPETPSAPELML